MASDGGPPWPGFVDALSTVLLMMVFFTLLMVLVVGTLSYIVAIKEVKPPEGASSETDTTKAEASLNALAELEDKKVERAMKKLQEIMNKAAVLTPADLDVPLDATPQQISDAEKLKKMKLEKKALNKLLVQARNRAVKAEDKAKNLQEALKDAQAFGKKEEMENKEEIKKVPFVTKVVRGMDAQHRIIILYNQLTSTVDEETKQAVLAWVEENRSTIQAHGLNLVAALNHEGVSGSMANTVSFKRLYSLIRLLNVEGKINKDKISFRATATSLPGSNQVSISLQ